MSAGSWLFSIFAVKTTPDEWLKYHRSLRDLGTYAVIIGVIAETLIDELWEIETPPLLRGRRATTLLKTKAAHWKKRLMLFVGVIMVGGGISIEIWQGGRADDVSDQIRTDLQRRLIRVQPRTALLNNEKALSALASVASEYSGQKFKIFVNLQTADDREEVALCASQINAVLAGAGWLDPLGKKIEFPIGIGSNVGYDPPDRNGVHGILFETYPDAPQRTTEAADKMVETLSSIGLFAYHNQSAMKGIPASSHDVMVVTVARRLEL
jgi:hypothetical protein